MARKLTKQRKKFADKYIDTGNGTQSALEATEATTDNSAAVYASNTLRDTKVQNYIAEKAEDAASEIYDLSQNGKIENVRLGASKDILDRAGFKPVEKTQSVNLNVEADLKDKDGLETIRQKYIEEVKVKLKK